MLLLLHDTQSGSMIFITAPFVRGNLDEEILWEPNCKCIGWQHPQLSKDASSAVVGATNSHLLTMGMGVIFLKKWLSLLPYTSLALGQNSVHFFFFNYRCFAFEDRNNVTTIPKNAYDAFFCFFWSFVVLPFSLYDKMNAYFWLRRISYESHFGSINYQISDWMSWHFYYAYAKSYPKRMRQ